MTGAGAGAPGLERAHRHGISTRVIEHRRFPSREDFDRALVEVLTEHGVELVVCAGFMRLLSPVMLSAFPDRVMNIHPALLPAFPGVHAQKAALEHGVRFTGCTVFFVREGVDYGPIIVQAVVPVMPGDDEESLSERIRAQEHRIYPWAIQLFQEGRLAIEGRTVRIADFPAGDESLARRLGAASLADSRNFTWSARAGKIAAILASRLESVPTARGVWGRTQSRAWLQQSQRWAIHLIRKRSWVLPPRAAVAPTANREADPRRQQPGA